MCLFYEVAAECAEAELDHCAIEENLSGNVHVIDTFLEVTLLKGKYRVITKLAGNRRFGGKILIWRENFDLEGK